MTAPVPSHDVEFGNLDANLRFLDGTGLMAPSRRVLEIGSGRGTLLHRLRARGIDVVGVETSEDRIREAQAAYGPLPIAITRGVLLPFPDASFDVVTSFDVLEHIADTDAHLAEVRRVLVPDGWYLLQTPNKWTNTVFETIRWRSVTRWRADHCALHSYRELTRRLQAQGFTPQFDDIAVLTPFFREKVRRHLGARGTVALRVINIDRWPLFLRTNFYVRARKI